eukprot:CAMPEP_0170865318 /NCGR_PEP_ID=MMETSP0734-20130129/21187_1 /TAXON_ID=186038 /ORGANISM="Fragilariopsis kerguelensis, Strain L26-C5" /LENGTH=449 /DNA_ID=CAMNT_0011241465 /DNA_START=21 /DNA_END=1370 /DNA_ORIENTATION=+
MASISISSNIIRSISTSRNISRNRIRSINSNYCRRYYYSKNHHDSISVQNTISSSSLSHTKRHYQQHRPPFNRRFLTTTSKSSPENSKHITTTTTRKTKKKSVTPARSSSGVGVGSNPDPLPLRSNGSKVQIPKLSPAQAKQRYIDSQKRAGVFLKDPKASILKLQNELNHTKSKLLQEIEIPMWKRLINRVKTRQHSVINLLMASLAYILAHRLHLKMKAMQQLENEIHFEREKNSELRSILRSITTDEFIYDVVVTSTTVEVPLSKGTTNNRSLLPSWLWSWSTPTTVTLLEKEEDSTATKFVHALRMKLQEKIGVEGLEDDDRKQQQIKEIWNKNEKTIQRLQSVKEEQELKQPPSVEAEAISAIAVAVDVVTTADEKKKSGNENGHGHGNSAGKKDDDGLLDLLTEVTATKDYAVVMEETANDPKSGATSSSSSSTTKKQRVFDM